LFSSRGAASKLALGISGSSWPLLQRLQVRGYVDQIALTPGAASTLEIKSTDVLVASASEIIRIYWQVDGVLLIVGAIGAVTRLVAPILKSKEEDPAVLVLDANGKHVVPLLGGHRAGAESLALQLAADLGGKAVLIGPLAPQEDWTIRRNPFDHGKQLGGAMRMPWYHD